MCGSITGFARDYRENVARASDGVDGMDFEMLRLAKL
jgi:hypothetical protein